MYRTHSSAVCIGNFIGDLTSFVVMKRVCKMHIQVLSVLLHILLSKLWSDRRLLIYYLISLTDFHNPKTNVLHNTDVTLGSGIDGAYKNAACPVALRLGGRKC